MIRIRSRVLEYLPEIPEFGQNTVKNKPMLFNCDMGHAMQLGGPITHAFLSRIPMDWHEEPLVIDTRVHMLMPGWFPCIPGWHHDDVPRTLPGNQPNYGPGQDRSMHIVGLVNGDVCPTEFAVGDCEFNEPTPYGGPLYEQWHREVEERLKTGHLAKQRMLGNNVWMFDDRTWHQGSRALSAGWRWFGRVSRYFDKDGGCIARRNARTNEVRRQVQVYLENPFKGW